MPARIVVVCGAFALMFLSLPAYGDDNAGWVYTSSNASCVWDDAQIGMDNSRPAVGITIRSDVSSFTYGGSTACGVVYWPGKGGQAIRNELYKWDGSEWALCASQPGSDYAYSTNNTFYIYMQAVTPTICNPGWYAVVGWGWTFDNGWKGGWMQSPAMDFEG